MTDFVAGSPFEVELEKDLSLRKQILDVAGRLSCELPEASESVAELTVAGAGLLAKGLDSELLSESAVLLLHWGILLEIADGYARISRRARGLELLRKFESEQALLLENP